MFILLIFKGWQVWNLIRLSVFKKSIFFLCKMKYLLVCNIILQMLQKSESADEGMDVQDLLTGVEAVYSDDESRCV